MPISASRFLPPWPPGIKGIVAASHTCTIAFDDGILRIIGIDHMTDSDFWDYLVTEGANHGLPRQSQSTAPSNAYAPQLGGSYTFFCQGCGAPSSGPIWACNCGKVNDLSQYVPQQGQGAVQQAGQPTGLVPLKTKSTPFQPLPVKLPKTTFRLGEFVGWRGWYPARHFLKSYAMKYIWPPGEPAEGKPWVGEEGIYAFKSCGEFFRELGNSDLIYGRVSLWGDVIEHEHGYRAQYAKILSLDGHTFESDFDLEPLRKTYGISA